jgi:hypothetical protein
MKKKKQSKHITYMVLVLFAFNNEKESFKF